MGSLSTHLLNSHSMALQHNSQQGNSTQMVYSGPMSYNAAAHGNFNPPFPSTPFPALLDPSQLPPEPTFYDISVATHKQIVTLQAKLDRKLGPEYISQRPGPGGGPKLSYAEGWKIINLANEVFGFNGWSSSICSLSVDYLDPIEDGKRWSCGVSAVVRVTLKDGVYHEDIGYGVAENVKGKGGALDKCKKEAVTDAIKRTLRTFGNLLGNCLYDKHYTQEVVKIKVPAPKFDRSTLHRRPEFEEGSSRDIKPEPTAPAHTENKGSVLNASNKNHNSHLVKPEKASTSNLSNQSMVDRNTAPFVVNHNNFKAAELKNEHNECTDKEEPSYFNSEDDSYFMQLDMEESGGVGLEEDRPIDCEIDYEDSRTNCDIGANETTRPAKTNIEKNYQERQEVLPQFRQVKQQPQPIGTAVKSAETTPQASTCLGGFHFPPSMDRPSSHVIEVGVKRGVDSISEPNANYKREAVIQNALRTHTNNTANKEGKGREPLAPFKENDVKRMRHY